MITHSNWCFLCHHLALPCAALNPFASSRSLRLSVLPGKTRRRSVSALRLPHCKGGARSASRHCTWSFRSHPPPRVRAPQSPQCIIRMVSIPLWIPFCKKNIKKMNINKKTKDEKDEKEQTWWKMFCWIVPNLKIALNFFLHSPQKKTKQLEGETIYIRHSNLMLEVCMNISSPFQLSDPFVFAFMSACMSNFFWRHCIYLFFSSLDCLS